MNRGDHVKATNAHGGKSEKSSGTAPVSLFHTRKKGNDSQAEMTTSYSGVSIMSASHSKKPVVVNGRQVVNGANRSTKHISCRSATHMSQVKHSSCSSAYHLQSKLAFQGELPAFIFVSSHSLICFWNSRV